MKIILGISVPQSAIWLGNAVQQMLTFFSHLWTLCTGTLSRQHLPVSKKVNKQNRWDLGLGIDIFCWCLSVPTEFHMVSTYYTTFIIHRLKQLSLFHHIYTCSRNDGKRVLIAALSCMVNACMKPLQIRQCILHIHNIYMWCMALSCNVGHNWAYLVVPPSPLADAKERRFMVWWGLFPGCSCYIF